MKIKVVIIDVDGTVWSINDIFKGQNYAAEKLGFAPKSFEEHRQFWRRHQDYRSGIGTLWPGINFNEFIKIIFGETFENEETILFPSVIEVLDELKRRGLLLGLLTTRDQRSLIIKAVKANLPLTIFDYIQTPDDCSVLKPNPRVFLWIINSLAYKGISPQEIIYIGDSTDDLAAAEDINFIGVRSGIATEEDFLNAGASPEILVSSFADILEHSLFKT